MDVVTHTEADYQPAANTYPVRVYRVIKEAPEDMKWWDMEIKGYMVQEWTYDAPLDEDGCGWAAHIEHIHNIHPDHIVVYIKSVFCR